MEMIFGTSRFKVHMISDGYMIEDVKNMRKFHNKSLDDLLSDVIKNLSLMECEKAFELLDEYELYKNSIKNMEIIHQDNKIIDDLKEESRQLKSENRELIKLVNQLVEEHCSLTEMILNKQEIAQKRFERLLNEVFENKKI